VIDPAHDAFGAALLDYLDGSHVPELTLEVKDGSSGPAMHPEWFFRSFESWDWWERELLPLITSGPVLDLGSGAGRAALHFQQQGLPVTAVDASPGAVERCLAHAAVNKCAFPEGRFVVISDLLLSGAVRATVGAAGARPAPRGRRKVMRRYLAWSVLAGCLLVLLPGSALAGSSTYYAGTNSQGQKLLFTVDHTASGPSFDPFFTNMIDRCPVTGNVLTVEFSFQGFQIPIKNGKFSLTLNSLTDRFRWSGTVTPAKASGKESFALAAFDREGGLQDCATGTLSWTAQALAPRSAKGPARGAAYVIRVVRTAHGSVRFSVTH
jgi:hypothetical protein